MGGTNFFPPERRMMALYLEPFERSYLLFLLAGSAYDGDKPMFVAKKQLLSKVIDDVTRAKNIETCEHAYGDYIGKKSCCKKCGAFPEGSIMSWEIKEGYVK